MVLKLIGAGLTPESHLSRRGIIRSPPGSEIRPFHHPAKAPGKPQEGPLRPCCPRNAGKPAAIENRINPLSAIHNVKQNHKPRCLPSNQQPSEPTMAGFHFKLCAHHYRLTKITNRDASLLLFSGFSTNQIVKQLMAKNKAANQKP